MSDVVHAIWNPDRCEEGVFCPKCDTWMDDYQCQPDKCPNCGVELDGWIDIRDLKKEKKKWVNLYVTIAYIIALIIRIIFALTVKVFGVMQNTEEL